MMLLLPLVLFAQQEPALTEASVATSGTIVAMSHSADAANVIALSGADFSELDRLESIPRSSQWVGARSAWGVIDDACYYLVGVEVPDLQMVGTSIRIPDAIAWRRSLETGRADREAEQRINDYSQSHGRVFDVLIRHLLMLEHSEQVRRENWNLSFDLAYTDINAVALMVAREGRLRWWEFNKPEHEDWVEHEEIETAMVGHFRIVQAADDMYLIDSEGTVFASPANGHQRLGEITGWGDVREGERLVILEDQQQDKIAIVSVADETVSVLQFEGDADAAEDFITEITSEELRAGLLRMDEILDEEEQEIE